VSGSESGRAADGGDGRRASSVRCHVSPFLDLEIDRAIGITAPATSRFLRLRTRFSVEGEALEPVWDRHIASHAIAEAPERARRETSVDAE
jgi:hypothetical protein